MSIVIRNKEITTHDSTDIYRSDGTAMHIHQTDSVYISEEVPVDDDEELCVDIGFEVYKAKEAEQLVSGWASVSVNADGSIPLDWQDDIITPEVLEKAAINFMVDYQQSGVMHKGDAVGTVVESIVLTEDKQEAIGIPEGTVPQGWFITVKVHDPEVFSKVKDGTYKMFSIQGTCKRVKL